MISQLYIFSPGSYVVADEWNGNFAAIDNSNTDCEEAIADANSVICFEDSDMTQVFAAINAGANSVNIPGTSITLSPNIEYYKALSNGTDLTVTIPDSMVGESRLVISTADDRPLAPITFLYSGDVVWNNGIADWYLAGTKFVFIYVINGTAYIKMVSSEE